jgi:hypothetical protein
MVTKGGLFGVCPNRVFQGDVVCILHGSRQPSVIRKKGENFVFVGTCHIHGLTETHAIQSWMDRKKSRIENIQLQ